MSGVFRLPSLAVSSGFETPVVAAALPHELGSGADPALAVVEGAYRPSGTVCRFIQPQGLVALRLAGPVPPLLRVVLTIRADRHSDDRWRERVTRQARARAIRGVDTHPTPPADPAGLPRAVRVLVAGRLRAAVLLHTDGSDDAWTRQRIVLDVAASEIVAGHLLLGVASSSLAPDPVFGEGLDDSLVGVCITRIRVRVADDQGTGTVSTGAVADDDGWQPYDDRLGAVLSSSAAHPVRLEVRWSEMPARQGLLRRASPGPVLEASDLAGVPVAVETLGTSGAVVAYRLPGDQGPLRVRVRTADGEAPVGIALRTG